VIERIAIGTPCYGGSVTCGYASSLASSTSLFYNEGITLFPIFLPNHSLIPAARNTVLHEALKRGVDALVWIDADIEWNPDHLVRLCSTDRDVVGATYKQKRTDETVYVMRSEKKIVPDQNGYAEVDGLGCGFLFVSRKALRDVAEASGKYEDKGVLMRNVFELEVRDGRLFSEDYVFCRKLREAGHKIWLDTGIDLIHHGNLGYVGNIKAYLNEIQVA
jgi:glycosyltransferase involved in cell wall biosynthesis